VGVHRPGAGTVTVTILGGKYNAFIAGERKDYWNNTHKKSAEQMLSAFRL
jgi:hypothetical protein